MNERLEIKINEGRNNELIQGTCEVVQIKHYKIGFNLNYVNTSVFTQ
jgi:hypothetical protein